MTYRIAAFYRFVALKDLPELRQMLRAEFLSLGLCGTLLMAPEGINGTLAGEDSAIEKMLLLLHQQTSLPREDVKFSTATDRPFKRLKLRLKREIITFRQPSADPAQRAGTYVSAQEWNALLDDPDVYVLDTRNRYETERGVFEGALVPPIDTFTQFSNFVRTQLDPVQHKKIAMYCTGGIRCEKASAFMLAEGFSQVYHLRGGILRYLEQVRPEDSKWRGDCFVFDDRETISTPPPIER